VAALRDIAAALEDLAGGVVCRRITMRWFSTPRLRALPLGQRPRGNATTGCSRTRAAASPPSAKNCGVVISEEAVLEDLVASLR
jgi:hypothetical protein